MKQKRDVFKVIAPVYDLFYNFQKKGYRKTLDLALPRLQQEEARTILDVGCGTGALASVLQERGYQVTGLDPVAEMLDKGRKRLENRGIDFRLGSILENDLADGSFDLAIAAYVAHGLQAEDRKTMLLEMKRIARTAVILHEYNGKRKWLTDIAEYLEGGDYFNFIRTIDEEFRDIFPHRMVIPIGKQAVWHVGFTNKGE